jgi:hypothetical protein
MVTVEGVQSTGAGVGTTMTIPPLGLGLGLGLTFEVGVGVGEAAPAAGPAGVPLPAQPDRSIVNAIVKAMRDDNMRALMKCAALSFKPSTRAPLSCFEKREEP